MELILTDAAGKELRELMDADVDIDLGDTNDFAITFSREKAPKDIRKGCRIFCPGTEYGGLVGGLRSDTAQDSLTYTGRTWRGMLEKKIIQPPAGEDHRTVSGELNTVLKGLVEAEFPGLFFVSGEDTGASVSDFRFDRYCTLLDGINKMLSQKGYRLTIAYRQGERGETGDVQLSASPVVDHSAQIELSQDSQTDFTFEKIENGLNHLICLGKGEGKERTVLHLYVQADGSIGKTPYYTGVQEIAATYEYSNAEADDLEKDGTEHLKEQMDRESFRMDVASLGLEVGIGDIVGGRDYLTGLSMKRPVAGKIWTRKAGEESVEYKIEGETE